MIDLLLQSAASILQPNVFLSMLAGVAAGLVGGAIPGITITMTVILVLPFTFGMDSLQALAVLIGVYIGGESGGLVSACLLGIPGTPSAIATTFDGFPMARKGQPGRAVWLGIWSSLFGGLLAGVPLVVGAVGLATLALAFGPWEYFSLFILTLSVVAGLSEKSLLKGLLSGVFGLLVTTIGSDPIMAVPRFTLGWDFLRSGFPFLPILIGIFAFAQVMSDVEKIEALRGRQIQDRVNLSVNHREVIREILQQPRNLLWSTAVGLWIGVLPAVGGSAANILAYDQAKKLSKHPERFGTGIPDGIIATESSNNANIGGSLITMMAFGIPGDAVSAVMIGALLIHGIQPGPLFISNHARLAYGMFAAYFIAHFCAVVLEWIGLKAVLRVVTVPKHILIPCILVLCVVGSFALNSLMADVWTLFIFGVVGYLMVRFGFPLAPIILGVVLGDQIEINFIRSIMTDPDWTLFFTRPISGIFLLASVVSFVVAVLQMRRTARLEAAAKQPKEPEDMEF